jgi:5-methylcytosine-specific restriction endonuclease McrA
MKYNYVCPRCNQWREIEWADVDKTFQCHSTKQDYLPPRPAQQPGAFVDQHEWPSEMETAVIKMKGTKCCVPGCSKKYETLDHRIAWSKGGKTSVENLWPMCVEHNSSKGDTDWNTWLQTRR